MADVEGDQGLDGGAVVPEHLVETISAWLPMPYEAIVDSEYHVWLWERMAMIHAGLRSPTLVERIRGRMTVEGESGYEHDFDVTWRAWAVERRRRLIHHFNLKARIGRWLHDRYLSEYCPEED